jgi:TrmH family RNA methyltransferase
MISSSSNDKVKHAHALLQQRKAREQQRQFVIEGARLIQEAERAGMMPALFFCTPAFLDGEHGRRLSAPWRAAAELVADKVLAALSGTVTPQGTVAVVPFPSLAPARRSLVLILDQLRDPGNLGTLLRSALAAGVDEVLLSEGSADPYNPKVVRSAMGAHFRLPLQSGLTWESIAEQCAALNLLLADTSGDRAYDAYDWRRPSALIIGGEANGASPAARAAAARRLFIPMHGASESLNAAVAGSIFLFEAARQRRGTVQSAK